jgi:hypothetical protein
MELAIVQENAFRSDEHSSIVEHPIVGFGKAAGNKHIVASRESDPRLQGGPVLRLGMSHHRLLIESVAGDNELGKQDQLRTLCNRLFDCLGAKPPIPVGVERLGCHLPDAEREHRFTPPSARHRPP